MPPRIDPYASKLHRRIDIILVGLTVLLIVFAFRYSAHSRTNSSPKTLVSQAQGVPHK